MIAREVLVGWDVATRRKNLLDFAMHLPLPLTMWPTSLLANLKFCRGGGAMRNIQKLVTLSFLIALQVLLTRFLGIETPVIRISFGFIPLALSGALFGPIAGGIVGALADIIGMMVFPKGAYFPGFTISNALSGMIYGYFLYNKPKKIINISLAVISVMIFVNIGLNTIWLSMLTKKGVYAIIGPRIIKNLIEVPIKVSCIYFVWKLVGVHLNKDIKKIAV